jgi:hypothetical protein
MSEVEGRLKVKRSDFYAVLAEELIAFVDNVGGEIEMFRPMYLLWTSLIDMFLSQSATTNACAVL